MPPITNSHPPPPPFPFLRLPREIRDQIYTHLAIAGGHYYETAGLLGRHNPYRGGADITAIPTIPSLISSRYLSGLLVASRQIRREALAAVYAAPVGMAVRACALHGDRVRSDHSSQLEQHNARLQALSFTLPRTILGMGLARVQLQQQQQRPQNHDGWYDCWPRKLEHLVLCVCPRVRQLAVAVEGDGGVQWRALAENVEDPEDDEVFASAGGVWIDSEPWKAKWKITSESREDDDDEYDPEYDGYWLYLRLTERPQAVDMLVRHREIADLLAWVPPVESELREYSVVVRQNLGLPVLDVAGKVEKRRVLGTPFQSERWSLDLTFWEVLWDWLVMTAEDRLKRRSMIATLVEEGTERTSSLCQLPTAIAAKLTIRAEAVYSAWVDAGKPSAEEIDEAHLDSVGLAGLFELDIA